jgi:hypothetical protein
MCKFFHLFFFANLDTFWVKLRLINEDLRVVNTTKSNRPRSQASDIFASVGTGRACLYHAAVPPAIASVRSTGIFKTLKSSFQKFQKTGCVTSLVEKRALVTVGNGL